LLVSRAGTGALQEEGGTMYHLHYQLAKDLQAERLREAQRARLGNALLRRRRDALLRQADHEIENDTVSRRTATASPAPAMASDAPVECC
jgi:hypothetical protein